MYTLYVRMLVWGGVYGWVFSGILARDSEAKIQHTLQCTHNTYYKIEVLGSVLACG